MRRPSRQRAAPREVQVLSREAARRNGDRAVRDGWWSGSWYLSPPIRSLKTQNDRAVAVHANRRQNHLISDRWPSAGPLPAGRGARVAKEISPAVSGCAADRRYFIDAARRR